MNCPNCEAVGSIVKDTRQLKTQNVRHRRRRCVKCNHRFSTWESTGPAPVRLKQVGWLEIKRMPFMGKVT